jgi:PIN domain nuclease of toxin-antitoxin system
VRLLLDTQALILLVGQPVGLPAIAQAAIEDPANEVLLSLATPWEMQIKINLGKLTLGKPLSQFVQLELDRGTFSLLPITLAHIDELSRLPSHHRDPFDRLLVAQAIHESLTLVTSDHQIRFYPVPTLWD